MIGYASLEGYGSQTLHLIDEMQIGTTQESLCGASPEYGCLWLALEGPSKKPTCLACVRAKGLQAFKHRFRKLKLVRGGGQ